MLARCSSAALVGLDAQEVTVEVDIAPGLPGLHMVGLADTAVQESRERVRSALRHSGLNVPLTRVVVNLAPADLRKEGPGFDLPIALGLLIASGQLPPQAIDGIWSCGELGLDGALRPVRGVLALALQAKRCRAKALIVPAPNLREAQLVDGLNAWGAENLAAVVAQLKGLPPPIAITQPAAVPGPAMEQTMAMGAGMADLSDVRGQPHGRRALEISAAGGHHLLLCGAPGSGKTMLAKRLAGLLPPLSGGEALAITAIHSVAGQLGAEAGLVQQRPVRSPHHSCSAAALIGGGAIPKPGELSLAHLGVLFLDELTEFRRSVLDQLRQPLEDGEIWLQRARHRSHFPCRVTLVAATNPCPCGWHGDPERLCSCSEAIRRRYWARLSGPLLDRLDLQVVMRRPNSDELAAPFRQNPSPESESSSKVAKRVRQARRRMAERNPGGCSNGQLASARLSAVIKLSSGALALWEGALNQRKLSARAGDRLLRVAQTITDLDGQTEIGPGAIAEALTFRSFDQLTY